MALITASIVPLRSKVHVFVSQENHSSIEQVSGDVLHPVKRSQNVHREIRRKSFFMKNICHIIKILLKFFLKILDEQGNNESTDEPINTSS